MDSITGDRWIADYARWVRVHEAKLGDVGRRIISTGSRGQPSRSEAATTSSFLWSSATFGTSTSATSPTPKPLSLRLNPHYLYYLLIRFEALTLPVGPVDVKIPAAAQPTTSFSWVSAQYGKDRSDTMSLSSIRSGLSVVSSSFSSASSWFTSTPAHQDPNRDVKYLYSSFTKIPNLYLGPIPARKLVQDFEDSPGQLSVPLDVFKNLQLLELEDIDPRTLIGWDRLSVQLRSLTCRRSSVEDLSHLLIDLVIDDNRRRRGEKTSGRRPALCEGAEALESDDTGHKGTSTVPTPSFVTSDMPSHAWQFLRYLNISSNNLTFVPSESLLQLSGLTNLDLSSNLLNLVPPSLSQLSSLTSLNISDNLIDSVLGIYDTIKGIRVLNISKNRLESLCGLERLPMLERIDLRSNSIYEAGEVGRLATLRKIKEVWVRGNPLVEELVDYRVECYVEFAREQRAVVLDGEPPGFFEKQRIAERTPQTKRAEPMGSPRSARNNKALSGETGNAESIDHVSTVVKNVRHKATGGSSLSQPNAAGNLQKPKLKPAESSYEAKKSTKMGMNETAGRSTAEKASTSRRRVQRLVELDTSPQKPTSSASTSDPAPATTVIRRPQSATELSDSDYIKRAALSGDSAGALESPDPKRAQTVAAQQLPVCHDKPSRPQKASAVAEVVTAEATTTNNSRAVSNDYGQDRWSKHTDSTQAETPAPVSTNVASASANRSEALRRKIEALKHEVGDDWLRLLSRGDIAPSPQEHADAAKTLDASSDVHEGHAAYDQTAASDSIQASHSKWKGSRRNAQIK